ncbi:hypothetical protein LPUS_06136 [Lasallia pustulata]|uniref:Uncharacterized protein n=1 Tax=Lasallia pustulata TaxID=136370 RepID=A0A1W5D0E4_9LECA|nr:hypothetical protein LPUS_06136 [Lasallia pustulata]
MCTKAFPIFYLRAANEDAVNDVVLLQVSLVPSRLEGVEAESLFFAAYTQRFRTREPDVNGAILRNPLSALVITSAAKMLNRVILTTVAKQHREHVRPIKNPMEENGPV